MQPCSNTLSPSTTSPQYYRIQFYPRCYKLFLICMLCCMMFQSSVFIGFYTLLSAGMSLIIHRACDRVYDSGHLDQSLSYSFRDAGFLQRSLGILNPVSPYKRAFWRQFPNVPNLANITLDRQTRARATACPQPWLRREYCIPRQDRCIFPIPALYCKPISVTRKLVLRIIVPAEVQSVPH